MWDKIRENDKTARGVREMSGNFMRGNKVGTLKV